MNDSDVRFGAAGPSWEQLLAERNRLADELAECRRDYDKLNARHTRDLFPGFELESESPWSGAVAGKMRMYRNPQQGHGFGVQVFTVGGGEIRMAVLR